MRRAVTGLLAALLVGCGTSGSQGPASGPADTPSPAASESPRPTPWPARTVDAVLVLAAADSEIAKAGADLQRAAESEDLDLMRRAADGLAEVIAGNEVNVQRVEAYPALAPVAAKYRAAFPVMLDGARRLSEAVDAGDSVTIGRASQRLADGLRLYAVVRPEIGDLATRALEMKRLLVK